MGMAMMANINALFVMFVGHAKFDRSVAPTTHSGAYISRFGDFVSMTLTTMTEPIALSLVHARGVTAITWRKPPPPPRPPPPQKSLIGQWYTLSHKHLTLVEVSSKASHAGFYYM